MGMIHQCKCDACGLTVEAGKALSNESVFPPGWYVAHWQEKNSNAMGSGYALVKMLSYCVQCGPKILSDVSSIVVRKKDPTSGNPDATFTSVCQVCGKVYSDDCGFCNR